MKSALVYLLMTRLKAQLKELVRKPARIVYLVLVVALFAVALLGGGGHAAAAGCTIEAPWAEARDRILGAIAHHAPDFTA